MKIDNPNHPNHYAYQHSLNRIGATAAFLTTIATIFYLLPFDVAVIILTITIVIVPLLSYLIIGLVQILVEDAIPDLIYWLKGY